MLRPEDLLVHVLWRDKSFIFLDKSLHVTDSVGGAKPCKIFHLGALPPCPPAGTCLASTLVAKSNASKTTQSLET